MSGYTLWFDATKITGSADGALLGTWPDSSGNHYDATNSTSAKPTYYSTTTAKLINGHPAVYFTKGSNSTYLSTATTTPGAPPGYLFAVEACTLPASSGSLPLLDRFNWTFGLATNPSALYQEAAGSLLTAGLPDTSPHQVTYWMGGTSGGNIRVDGTQVGSKSSTGTNTGSSNPINIGCSGPPNSTNGFDGRIGELIYYYNVSLTLAQIQNIEAYLKAKWGTP